MTIRILTKSRLPNALNHYLDHGHSVFMDVGANIGKISLLVHDTIKQGIAIEPFPESYEMLCENLAQVSMMPTAMSGVYPKINMKPCNLPSPTPKAQ